MHKIYTADKKVNEPAQIHRITNTSVYFDFKVWTPSISEPDDDGLEDTKEGGAANTHIPAHSVKGEN